MAKITLSKDDLGEDAEFIMDSAATSPDPLDLLLRAEEEADESFYDALEALLAVHRLKRLSALH